MMSLTQTLHTIHVIQSNSCTIHTLKNTLTSTFETNKMLKTCLVFLSVGDHQQTRTPNTHRWHTHAATYCVIKPRIILLLTRITSLHVYVLERYDICMVRCHTQHEWHVTGSSLSWRIVLSRCDVITVEVVLKVISVGTPAIRHIHVNKNSTNANQREEQ